MPLQLSVHFVSKEAYIPRDKINDELKHLKHIRCIQLLNWHRIKSRLMSTYPMIDAVELTWSKGQVLTIIIKNKPPWMMVLHKDDQYLYSMDGTWLNQMSGDLELPDNQIIIVDSKTSSANIHASYRQAIAQIDADIRDVPLFDIKKFILSDAGLEVLTNSEVLIKFGSLDDIESKLIRAKYFLSFYKTKLNLVEYIDIRFPRRVIVK